jgi:ferredoxin
MTGCPAGAFSREPDSDAVIVSERKCIGCNYCTWNCPYDAPKPLREKGVIEKCNLCYTRLAGGLEPACTSACPTGALKYGSIPEDNLINKPDWFPDKNLGPSIWFRRSKKTEILKITPEPSMEHSEVKSVEIPEMISSDWSLILFTFLTACSVANVCSSIIKGIPGKPVVTIGTLLAAALASVFHLGRKFRAFRAILNVRNSPLSREIVLFLIYTSAAVLSSFSESAELIVITSVTGLILLLSIDSVYYFSEGSGKLKLNSGQTFITGLLITSLFAEAIVPFLFIAAIKLTLTVGSQMGPGRRSVQAILKFSRFGLLFISSVALASGLVNFTPVIYGVVLSGEFLDRILFYFDFRTLNIDSSIREN